MPIGVIGDYSARIMCGFAGVISWSEDHRTSRSTLARMSAAIAHRGPDGEGIYFNHDPDDLSVPITPERPQVALAFRRLGRGHGA